MNSDLYCFEEIKLPNDLPFNEYIYGIRENKKEIIYNNNVYKPCIFYDNSENYEIYVNNENLDDQIVVVGDEIYKFINNKQFVGVYKDKPVYFDEKNLYIDKEVHENMGTEVFYVFVCMNKIVYLSYFYDKIYEYNPETREKSEDKYLVGSQLLEGVFDPDIYVKDNKVYLKTESELYCISI